MTTFVPKVNTNLTTSVSRTVVAFMHAMTIFVHNKHNYIIVTS